MFPVKFFTFFLSMVDNSQILSQITNWNGRHEFQYIIEKIHSLFTNSSLLVRVTRYGKERGRHSIDHDESFTLLEPNLKMTLFYSSGYTFCIHDIEYMKSTGGINRITIKDGQNNFPELKIGTELTLGELQNYLKKIVIKQESCDHNEVYGTCWQTCIGIGFIIRKGRVKDLSISLTWRILSPRNNHPLTMTIPHWF